MYRLITLEGGYDDEFWWLENDSWLEYSSIQRLCVEASTLGIEGKALLNDHRDESFAVRILEKCRKLDQICEKQWTCLFENTQHKGARTCQDVGSNRTSLFLLPLWNLLTCARILLNSVIISCTACLHERVDYRTTKDYVSAYSVLQGVVLESLAMNERSIGRNHEQRSPSSEIRGERSVPGLRGQSMVWPCTFIWSLACLTQDQRTAVSNQIEFIGSQLGIRCALSLRDDKEGMPPYWFTMGRQSGTRLLSQRH